MSAYWRHFIEKEITIHTDIVSNVCADRKKALEMKDLIPQPGYPIFEETSVYLAEMLHRYKPQRILDTGAGWTSVLLRKYWSSAQIVSVEMEPLWLDRAAELIRRFGVDGMGQLHLWKDFLLQDHDLFDFVSHDLGNMQIRKETLPTAVSYLKPAGVIFLDNFGVRGYKTFAGPHLTSRGFRPVYPRDPMKLDVAEAGKYAVYARGYEDV